MNGNVLKVLMRTTLVVAVAATFFVAGCSDDDDPSFTLEGPGSVSFRNFMGQVELTWGASPSEGSAEFVGYNVYRDTESMNGVGTDKLDGLRINAAIVPSGDNNYTDENATSGVRYYYQVRGVQDDGSLSVPSGEVSSASILSGAVISIGEFSSPDPSGIDLSAGTALSMTDGNAGMIDFYLGTADDTADGDLVIKSPHLVNDDAKWQAVRTDFLLLASDDIASAEAASFNASSLVLGSTNDEIDGLVIAVRIKEADDEIHYGKFEILGYDEDTQGRSISIDWNYQPIPAFARF